MTAPRVSFVSLGCPKALVDSERILTRLRAEGYEIARKHDGADLDVTAARLREAGVRLTVEPKMGLDGNRQCWIEDPDGNRIEFMQMSRDGMQAEAIRRLRGA
jgi:catechol 2,3-dioxygenase-like lactoylglutathione lyase family enzyme